MFLLYVPSTYVTFLCVRLSVTSGITFSFLSFFPTPLFSGCSCFTEVLKTSEGRRFNLPILKLQSRLALSRGAVQTSLFLHFFTAVAVSDCRPQNLCLYSPELQGPSRKLGSFSPQFSDLLLPIRPSLPIPPRLSYDWPSYSLSQRPCRLQEDVYCHGGILLRIW